MAGQLNLMQGTLDMLILKAVSLGPLHGYGVLLRIQQISGDQLAIQQGSLYPALFRLEHQGLIASEWGESDNKRKAKFYRLTASGRSRLRTEADNWNAWPPSCKRRGSWRPSIWEIFSSVFFAVFWASGR